MVESGCRYGGIDELEQPHRELHTLTENIRNNQIRTYGATQEVIKTEIDNRTDLLLSKRSLFPVAIPSCFV